MPCQLTLDEWTEEKPDPFGFDTYGPTMKRPVPAGEYQPLPGTDRDTRELPGTGLAPSDFELINGYGRNGVIDRGYHPDDEERPERRQRELENDGLVFALNRQDKVRHDYERELGRETQLAIA